MKRKIFISLDIPEKVRKRLVLTTKKWETLPIKWTRAVNLHFTLVFLGFVEEDDLADICEKIRKFALKNNAFDIEFGQIELFPSVDEPRSVALTGEPSEELKNLINTLEDGLGISSAPKKSFRPHITLGRIRKNPWEALEEKPEISEKFSLHLGVEAVDIMASDFENDEQEYSVIESCPLE